MTVENKQHIYSVCIVKREYFYVNVKANSGDDAEDIVIETLLNDPNANLDEYFDADEHEVIALDRIKRPSKALKTIN